ncbi:MAG: hypothetical protein A2941_01680 [Candidatus Yanofskybacteria bacterium RIFCSPLOWO2_01_FULL_49_17]|uniref:Peptidase S11 D-alanyl-D-alanine carboxypeptidase A N-terminal domain-containing protein n=1 Tax=Candidatus Yanofskybacteria bacterium RIFCSPLOWO2_01_FULL_49_17 TaxID=1802700 RepID=A0A1F8GTA8_9BACT|nr:MAG: hypothetical protein A2941_01680 [Candidatus Yanofskybacteria bacterium RIFCSPLOWO2_01_FULL_49_17]
MNLFRTISTAVVAALLGVNALVGFSLVRINSQLASAGSVFEGTSVAYVLPVTQADYLPAFDSLAGELAVDAKAALVLDVKTSRFLYQKNIQDRLAIASLTKIMTAIIAWENLDPNAIVTIQSSAVKADGERQELYREEKISVKNLMQLMLIKSSNDAAYALRDYAREQGTDLIQKMNEKAYQLEMYNTHYTDPAGLDDSAYSTAADLAKEVIYALRYDAIWNASRQPAASIESADGRFSHDVKSTDRLLGVLDDIVGGKTGYTDGALGCMILIVELPKTGDKIIGIVLGSKGRFEAMEKLIQWTQRAYRWQ